MASIFLTHKKLKWNFPAEYKVDNVQIGVEANDHNLGKVGLKNIGETILPNSKYGSNCRKNAEGYSYPDKTKEKEWRVVNTISFHPYGNLDAAEVYIDIERLCYPRLVVAPNGIELMLYEDESGKRYIIADLSDHNRNQTDLLRVINVFYEMFGECYLFSEEIKIDASFKRTRCNWEILPPGEKPSSFVRQQLDKSKNDKTKQYFEYRLRCIERHNPKEQVAGTNGFAGYYAYLFEKICVLECGFYGNATYIVNVDEWKILSRMTKYELFVLDKVIEKVVHAEKWASDIEEVFVRYENN